MSQSEFYKYIETPEFKELLTKYEGALSSGESVYMDADDVIDIAEYYHIQGRLDKAEGAADYCLELFPDDPAALLFKARMALIDKDDVNLAKELLNKVGDDESLEACYIKAELMVCENKIEDADKFLDEKYKELSAEGFDSNDDEDEEEEKVNMPMDIAMMYADHGLLILAEKWINRTSIPEDNDQKVDYYETRGRIHMEQENFEEAIKDWNNLLDINAYNFNAWLQLCDAQYHIEQYEDALQSVDFLIAINSNLPEPHMARGNCLYALGKLEEALKEFEEYQKMCPEEPMGQLLMASTLFCLNRIEEAYNHMMLMQKNFVDIPEVSQFEAMRISVAVASKMKFYDDAMLYCEQLDAMGFPSVETDLLRGAVLLEQGEPKKAMEVFAKAVEESDYEPRIMINIGIVFYEAHLFTAAYGMLKTVYESYERVNYQDCTPDGFPYLAAACKILGKTEDFEKYDKLAKERTPLDYPLILGENDGS